MKRLLVSLFLVVFYVSSFAGSITEELFTHLDEMAENDRVLCAIVMTDQFDADEFKRTMTMANSSRQERHNYVINSLQEIATYSQASLLARLEQLRRDNEVGDFRSYWITNAVHAELSKTAILELAGRGDIEALHLWQEPELIKPVQYDSEPPLIAVLRSGDTATQIAIPGWVRMLLTKEPLSRSNRASGPPSTTATRDPPARASDLPGRAEPPRSMLRKPLPTEGTQIRARPSEVLLRSLPSGNATRH